MKNLIFNQHVQKARWLLILSMLLTLSVGEMKAATIFNCGIDVNDTWYKGTGTINSGNWLGSKTAFNGANLGALTSMTLGGQYDTWDNNQTDYCSWNGNNGIHILIKKGSTQIANFKLTCYHDSKDGNNNVWKTKGGTGSCSDSGSWGTYTVDISGYAAGNDYTIKATWTSPSSQSNNATANFTINPVVTFKANGGTGSDYTQRVTYNTNTALTSNTFTKTGYDFAGWATSADGNVVYANGANVKLTAHTNLFAKWTPKTTTITLNNQEATTAGTTEVTATYDEEMPAITPPTKTGYTFGGYWGAPGGSGPKLYNADGSSNATWLNTESTYTLYAAWSENKSTVTLVASPTGTGTFQVGGVTVTSTQAGVATTPEVTAVPTAGYSFSGWSITGGASISSTSDNPTTVTGGGAGTAATLTATFVEDITYYKLKFGTRSGETDNGSVAAKDGSDNPLTSNTEYLSGTSVTVTATPADDYKFDSWYHGWSTGSSFSTVNPLTFTLSEATNVYAHFVQKTTSITLNKNGGSGGTAGPVTATHGSTTLSTNPLVKPAKSNYTFTGYWTESSGGTKVIDADGTLVASVSGYTKSGNKQWDYDDPTLTLYAQYSENKSTVTVTANETSWGTLKFASTSKSWGSTASVGVATSQNITATASSGYVFHNWELSGGATTASSLTGTTITLKGDGSGETGTAKANFGVASGWHMEGQDFGGWGGDNCSSLPTTTEFTYTYRGMANIYYVPLTLTKDHYFKVHHGNGCANVFNFGTNSADVTVSKGTIYSLTADASHSGKVSSTLSNVWAVVNTSTNKFWVQDQQTFHNVNVTNEGNGTKGTYKVTLETTSAFTKGSVVFETTQFASGETFKVTVTGVTGYIPTITIGATSTNFWKEANTYEATGTMSTSDIAVSITYTASRALTFSTTTGCATLTATGPGSTSVTSGTKIKDGTSITFAQTASTGYNFSKWYSNNTGTSGTQYATTSSYSLTVSSTAYTIYPIYTAKNYTVTLDVDEPNKGSIDGAATSHTVYYNTVVTDISPLPTAAAGCGLDGFYTSPDGVGTKLFNGDGSCIASVDGYTDGDKKWIRDGGVALYAYYKQAEITELTFVNAIVAQSVTNGVKVTPTISPTPTGTTHIDWRVLYSNGNPLASQPSMTAYNTTGVQFTSPEASGTYLVEAVLRTGSTPNAGTRLDSTTASFQVAGEHTVTIRYQDSEGNTLQASGSVTARPLVWSSAIEAPEIFGYTFHHWLAGDGVTLSEDGTNAKTGARADSSVVSPIYIKATYDGRLTAVYNQNQLIYFKNTLGWSDVYVNFYTGSYWNNPKGSGNKNVTNRDKHMTRIGETDVWYYDYGAEDITPSLFVSFTSISQNNYENFSNASPHVQVVYPANYQDDIHTDKSSENGFKAATPMFVPLADQSKTTLNSNADYYNRGYWTKYLPGTGYTLEVYNSDGNVLLKSFEFTSTDELMPMKAVADLDAATTYKFQIRRGGTDANGIYYGNSGTMTNTNHGSPTPWELTNHPSFSMVTIKTTATGDYTFNLSYSENASSQYRLRVAVDYPASAGDFQVLYSDTTSWSYGQHAAAWRHPSRVITARANGKDTISFFVYKGKKPAINARKISTINASTGAITWTATNIGSNESQSLESVAATGVYNFEVVQNAAGDAITAINNIGEYTGNYYIRTNAANNKWDSYRSSDHMMTYSEYSKTYSDYTHYFMSYVNNGTNIKFTIANDYSACVTDTLIQQTFRGGDASHVDASGNVQADANVRFMWDIRYNRLIRAYLAAAKNDGSKFLVLRANSSSDMMDVNGNALLESANSGQAGYNHKAPNNSIQFVDNENWIYETNIKILPGAYVKLYAYFHEAYFYYKGENNNTFDESNAIQILGGSGTAQLIRVIYDFKTDRLVAAWEPSGEIDGERAIKADVMFVREHQGDIAQLTFTESGKITKINTAYGVLRFNKYTLNNKSKADGHAPLSPALSRYERDLFYVSFPFKVAMNEVFGFGTYGKHWIIEYYDGAARAASGFWAETPTFWRYVTDRKGKYFEPNQGYIIALDLDELGESSDVWDNGVENVELYFPSYGTMDNITASEITHELPAHECTIGPRPGMSDDRRIKDSHWNIMSVPTYVNTSNIAFANTSWTATRPNFLYEWNPSDNSLTARSGIGYTYHAMHAYTVQYAGNVTWTSSVNVSPVVARRQNKPQELEFRIELRQDNTTADQTFVRMSNNEQVSTEFVFGEDMSKEFNGNKANIYTMVSTMIDGDLLISEAAGNVLPMSEQTTVVPVGVKIVTNDDYTFSIPEGTDGVGVTLIDTETGIRTSLSALDYTVSLEAGTYNDRFVIEISPIQHVATELETSDIRHQKSDVRKLLIDGLLYIVRDGKMFDARGARVE